MVLYNYYNNSCIDYIFDYQLAIDELKFYDSEIVPKIKKEDIPNEISNVKFQCNLTNIQAINRNDALLNNNQLFSKL